MTDDVTRGLAMLADEADPAPIDTHAVVALAKARTRGRRAVAASAIITVASVGALTVAVGAVNEPTTLGGTTTTVTETVERPATSVPGTGEFIPLDPRGPVLGTEAREPASPAEQAQRAQRLQGELIDAFGRILPDWDHSVFEFACDDRGCWAMGDIIDGGTPVRLFVYVHGEKSLDCSGTNCQKELLDDGTLVGIWRRDTDRVAGVNSVQHDGTSLSILMEWQKPRTESPLTDDQLRRFATVLTF